MSARPITIAAASIALVAVVAITGRGHAAQAQTSTCLSAPGVPRIDQIQNWVRAYYPGFLARTKSSGKVAVGFVLDPQCRVLRHGAAFLPDTGWSEDLIMVVFPDIHRTHETAGIADGVPSQVRRDGTLDQYLVATYIVLNR